MNLSELTNDELHEILAFLQTELDGFKQCNPYANPKHTFITIRESKISAIEAELEIRQPVQRLPNTDQTHDSLILTPNELLFGWSMVGTSNPNDEPESDSVPFGSNPRNRTPD